MKIRWIWVVAGALGLMVPALRAGDAQELYNKKCASCHGKDGKGDTKMGKKLKLKDFTDPATQSAMKDEEMVKTIQEGIKGDDGKTKMKAYADTISAEDVKGLVAYIRAFKK